MSVPTKQHTKPCRDCPWRRKAVRGWLGGMKSKEWLAAAHGEAVIECHTKGCQCAGAAIYRSNVKKLPRTPEILTLKPDSAVFAQPQEFLDYHDAELV